MSGQIAILAYHSLDQSGSVISLKPETFAAQMRTLARLGFRGVSLQTALAQREQRGEWTANDAVITFDDGYANLYQQALPVLRELGFGATVFLVTDFMAAFNDWEAPPAGFGRQATLTWDQVREMAAAGVEFGAHTATHPRLSRLSPAQIEHELTQSRDAIAEQLGAPPTSFAYPYGDTTESAYAAARRHFSAAVTTVLKRAAREPRERLPRLDTFYLQDLHRFSAAIQGRLDYYLWFRRCIRRARAFAGV